MLATFVVRVPSCVSSTARQSLLSKVAQTQNHVVCRNFASQARTSLRKRISKSKTLKEVAGQPADGTAITLGQGLVAGAGIAGIGALCYYGLGMSSEAGAIDRAAFWPQYVRDRIKTTYAYFGTGIASTAASAYAISRNPNLMAKLMPKSMWGALGMMAVLMGSGMVCMSIPYHEGFGMKQLAWLGHSALVGGILAPMSLLGGPLLVRAAWYTAGMVGGLSCVAACAPSDKFLYMGGPLAMGLGIVIVSSLGSMWFAPGTALGSGLYAISVYGGLVLFGGFMLYDTQKIMKRAELYPMYSDRPYDPINSAISIYTDTINIFIRMVMILSSGGGGKRK
ncbi:growth hormone-inducible transmembrane protein-like [Anneissia japonica]|uniref:growth hormone-inducible transmembrane protein-like n=1 Tax=Anneissia japonica TaxID=1529436 RepID=UPI00142578D3|nr:growth hormone-inducible transmembrane protein-like [Anneissia japonica]